MRISSRWQVSDILVMVKHGEERKGKKKKDEEEQREEKKKKEKNRGRDKERGPPGERE